MAHAKVAWSNGCETVRALLGEQEEKCNMGRITRTWGGRIHDCGGSHENDPEAESTA